jgi:hypothetical protein
MTSSWLPLRGGGQPGGRSARRRRVHEPFDGADGLGAVEPHPIRTLARNIVLLSRDRYSSTVPPAAARTSGAFRESGTQPLESRKTS